MNVIANIGTFIYFIGILLVGIFTCGQTASVASRAAMPTINVQITGNYCPSLEVQAGMQIAWTNLDDVDRVLLIERENDQDKVIRLGGTALFEEADTFWISLNEPGQYTYYCSKDRSAYGTITVLQ